MVPEAGTVARQVGICWAFASVAIRYQSRFGLIPKVDWEAGKCRSLAESRGSREMLQEFEYFAQRTVPSPQTTDRSTPLEAGFVHLPGNRFGNKGEQRKPPTGMQAGKIQPTLACQQATQPSIGQRVDRL